MAFFDTLTPNTPAGSAATKPSPKPKTGGSFFSDLQSNEEYQRIYKPYASAVEKAVDNIYQPAVYDKQEPKSFFRKFTDFSRKTGKGIADVWSAYRSGLERVAQETLRKQQAFTSNVSGTFGAFAKGAEWRGIDSAKPLGDKLNQWAEAVMPENPTFADKVASGAGSAFTFFLPGIGTAKGVAFFSRFSPKIARWTGAGVSTALEAMAEAGSVYDETLKEEKGEKEANKRATATFAFNAMLVGLTNKLGVFSDRTGSILKKMAIASPIEGVQEVGQQIISNWQMGRPISEGVLESGAIGAIIGGSMAGIAATSLPQDQRVTTQIRQSQAFNVDEAIAKGEIAPETVYKNTETKVLQPAFAEGRVNDVAQKLDNFKEGAGSTFRKSVDVNNLTMSKLVEKGLETLQKENIPLFGQNIKLPARKKEEEAKEIIQNLFDDIETAVETNGREEVVGELTEQGEVSEEEANAIVDEALAAPAKDRIDFEKFDSTDLEAEISALADEVRGITKTLQDQETKVAEEQPDLDMDEVFAKSRELTQKVFETEARSELGLEEGTMVIITEKGTGKEYEGTFVKDTKEGPILKRDDGIGFSMLFKSERFDVRPSVKETKYDETGAQKEITGALRRGLERREKTTGQKPEEGGIIKPYGKRDTTTIERPELPDTGEVPARADREGVREVEPERRADSATVLGELGAGLLGERSDVGLEKIGKKGRAKINEQVVAILEAQNYSTNPENYTAEDHELMKLYTGVGGKEAVGAEGKGLLSEFYTPNRVVQKVWELALAHAENDIQSAFEPSAGTGRFMALAPDSVSIDGIEIDKTSGTIAQILNPENSVEIGDFQNLFFKKTKDEWPGYDLVIGNPPYGERSGLLKGRGEESKIDRWEEYFIKRGLDMTNEGGLVAYVVNSSFLQKGTSKGKEAIAKIGKLIEAYRLPEGVFEDTKIGTDIVLFRKEEAVDAVAEMSRNQTMRDDMYFRDIMNADKILGETNIRTNRFGKEETYVEGGIDALERIDVPALAQPAVVPVVHEDPIIERPTPTKESKPVSLFDLSPAVEKVKADIVAGEDISKKDYGVKVSKTQDIYGGRKLTETERKVWRRLQRDGSTDYAGADAKSLLNYHKGKWFHDVMYYSGNVRQKLEDLESDRNDVEKDQYERQKAGLEAVVPSWVTIDDITFDPIDRHVLSEKLKEDEDSTVLNGFVRYLRNFDLTLPTGVYREDITRYVTGQNARKDTKHLMGRIKESSKRLFNLFVKNNLEVDVQNRIVERYNNEKNSYVRPDYRKIPTEVSGMATEFRDAPFKLSPTQKHGISFLTTKGSGLIAYEVGVGKTHTLLTATMTNMERGRAKRPLFIVPKSTIESTWIPTIRSMFPGRNIVNLGGLQAPVVRTLKKRYGEDPKEWIKDGDIAVISHQGILRLGFTEDEMQEAIGDLNDALWQEIKETKRGAAQKQEKIDEIAGNATKYAGDIKLSDLGIDHLSADEIHNFRKVFRGAKVETGAQGGTAQRKRFANVGGGIPSRQAQMMFMLSQYVQKKNGGNVFLASATPFENHATEVYNILSFVARDRMKQMGIFNINDFFAAYSNFETEMDKTLDGKWTHREKMKSFSNLPQLQALLREFVDFRVDETLVRPERRVMTPTLSMSAKQEENLAKIQNLLKGEIVEEEGETGDIELGKAEREEGAFLKASSYSVANSVSPYFIKEWTKEDISKEKLVEDSPKIKYAVELIRKLKDDTKTKDYGTFLYFGNFGVDYHEKVKEYLIENIGFPRTEVEVLNGQTDDDSRERIKDDFNEGIVKVLIGGDPTKEGIDLQRNGYVTINLALGWNPTEPAQVEGRVWRQGNKRNIAPLIYPLVENSGDATVYAKFEEKGGRINDLFSFQGQIFDVGEVDPREKKIALMTDPKDKAKMELEFERAQLDDERLALSTEIKNLEQLEFDRKDAEEEVERYTARAKEEEQKIKSGKKVFGRPSGDPEKLKLYKENITKEKARIARLDEWKLRKNITNIDEKVSELKKQVEVFEEQSKALDATYDARLARFKELRIQEEENRKSIDDHVNDFFEATGDLREYTDEEITAMRAKKIEEQARLQPDFLKMSQIEAPVRLAVQVLPNTVSSGFHESFSKDFNGIEPSWAIVVKGEPSMSVKISAKEAGMKLNIREVPKGTGNIVTDIYLPDVSQKDVGTAKRAFDMLAENYMQLEPSFSRIQRDPIGRFRPTSPADIMASFHEEDLKFMEDFGDKKPTEITDREVRQAQAIAEGYGFELPKAKTKIASFFRDITDSFSMREFEKSIREGSVAQFLKTKKGPFTPAQGRLHTQFVALGIDISSGAITKEQGDRRLRTLMDRFRRLVPPEFQTISTSELVPADYAAKQIQAYNDRLGLPDTTQIVDIIFDPDGAPAHGVTFDDTITLSAFVTKTTGVHELTHRIIHRMDKMEVFNGIDRSELLRAANNGVSVTDKKTLEEVSERLAVGMEEYVKGVQKPGLPGIITRFYERLKLALTDVYHAFGGQMGVVQDFYRRVEFAKNNAPVLGTQSSGIGGNLYTEINNLVAMDFGLFEKQADFQRIRNKELADIINKNVREDDGMGYDNIRKDINLLEDFMAQARDIYLKSPSDFKAADLFEKVAGLRRMKKISLDRHFAEILKPYFDLRGAEKERLNKVLMQGDQERTKYNKEQLIERGLKTPQEIDAYYKVRNAFEEAHEFLLKRMEENGVPEEELEEFRKLRIGYMPHRWEHRYVVKKRELTEDGWKTIEMEDFKTEKQARKAWKERKSGAVGNVRYDLYTLDSIETNFFSSQSLSVENMLSALDKTQAPAEYKKAVAAALRDMAKEKGFGKYYIRRANITGHETKNLDRVIADYFSGMTGYVTKMEAAPQYLRALQTVDPRRQKKFYAWMRDSIAYDMANSEEWNKVRTVAFTYMLANDISYLAINATQNWTVGISELSKLLTGKEKIAGAEVALIKSSFDWWRGNVSTEEREAINRWVRVGRLGGEMTSELLGFKNNPVYRSVSGRLNKALYSTTGFVEEHINRIPGYLAARRILIKKGMSEKEADVKALEISDDIHFRYGKQHRPEYVRGRKGALFIFTHYFRSYLWLLSRDVRKREFVAVTKKLFYLSVLGGTTALPFAKLLMKIVQEIVGDDEEEIKKEMSQWEIALTRGIPASLGVDISGNIAMDFFTLESVLDDPLNIMKWSGAAGGLMQRLWRGYELVKQDRYEEALGKILPDFAANPIKGYYGYRYGVRTFYGNFLETLSGEYYKYDTAEAIIRGLGFTPTEEGTLWEMRIKEAKEKVEESAKKTLLRSRIEERVIRGDIEGAREIERKAVQKGAVEADSHIVEEFTYDRLLKKHVEDARTKGDLQAGYKAFLAEVYGEREITKQKIANVKKEFKAYYVFGTENTAVDELLGTKLNADKVAVLLKAKQDMGDEVFAEFFGKARRVGIISDALRDLYRKTVTARP